MGELLGQTLENYLTEHKDVKKLLNGGVSAPLGTLSARILMAFGLRLIEESEYRNLQILRKIRNHFAHDLQASFEDKRVIDLCRQLDSSGLRAESLATPFRKYQAVTALQLLFLKKKPMMAVGRRLGELNWQDNVMKHLKREFSKRKKITDSRTSS
jgi:DNA-binding MltR family transcriptional regulator